jgi:antitoxin CptB
MSDAMINRLRWRCRRGTRELDRLLTWYLDTRYVTSDVAAQTAFADLLDAQDPDIWDWIMGRSRSAQTAVQNIVDDIRTHHRV